MRNRVRQILRILLLLCVLLILTVCGGGNSKPILTEEEETYLIELEQSIETIGNAATEIIIELIAPRSSTEAESTIPLAWNYTNVEPVLWRCAIIELEEYKFKDMRPPRSLIDIHAKYLESLLHFRAADDLFIEATKLHDHDLTEMSKELEIGFEVRAEVQKSIARKRGVSESVIGLFY